ncbi:nucleotidyltransferase domain-containing protein [Rhizobium sp. TH2]|uniref:nucleotidyltransferase domain-containing protein n=1 Tax=Rhizobium sp. TH2 TaxID=2775403 RepID=UPI0021571CA8|nr:nucleotidyltransferase domain-containing protein [Rhizobium sp. TH2]UVC11452.1 nucleotidyltransferase domain-containing protein [Rhizobium sp. TH2]
MERAVRANFGRHCDESEALADIVSRLKEALDPQAIWLFGSRARGAARPDSDFDLLVVAKPDGRFGCDDYEMVAAPLRATGIGADVVPCDQEVFKASLGLNTSFVRQIVDGGKLIYGEMPA